MGVFGSTTVYSTYLVLFDNTSFVYFVYDTSHLLSESSSFDYAV